MAIFGIWGKWLVIPILVVERKGPFSAFNESVRLLKRTWGEQVIGNFSFGLVFFALSLPGCIVIAASIFLTEGMAMLSLIVIGILYLILLTIIQTTLQGIFQAAIYQFARSNKVPAGFQGSLLKGAISQKL